MSYFRSYFEKNNTIIKDSQANTAKNPTTEIFYGSGFSKFIFKVDFTDLKNKITSGELVVDSDTKHTLHLTNTIFGDEGQKGLNRTTGRDRSTSFDLILFKVSEYWDEGIGYDYSDTGYDFVSGNRTYDERPSNWFFRTTLNNWQTAGVYNEYPTILKTIHFDNGNEDISVDITDYVNSVLTGGTTDYGLGLAFAPAYEQLSLSTPKSVAFFGKYTQSFYEPHVETFFQDIITDDRANFISGVEQNLYLYVTKAGNYYDLDAAPLVDITDSNKNVIPGLNDLQSVKVKKGVYKVTFGMTGMICDGKRFYLDVWKNITVGGMAVPNTVQKFIPNQYNAMYSIGGDNEEYQRYAVQFYGIKQNEEIDQVEVRKIVVRFRSIEQSQTDLFQNVYYKLYIQEGSSINVIVHDWTPLDRTNSQNCFFLDTTYLIPRFYYLEIKAEVNGETIFYNNVIQVDGVAVTPKWQGGTAPTSGNASSVDVYTYTCIKTAAATWTVLAARTQFK